MATSTASITLLVRYCKEGLAKFQLSRMGGLFYLSHLFMHADNVREHLYGCRQAMS